MRILLLGSGGREHALAWKLSQSVWTNPLFIAPGNPGTAQCGTNVNLDLSDFDAIAKFCIYERIEIVVVGPENVGKSTICNSISKIREAAASAGLPPYKPTVALRCESFRNKEGKQHVLKEIKVLIIEL